MKAEEVGCCNKCRESFKCEILFQHHESLFHVDYEYQTDDSYFVLKCPHCSNIFYKSVTKFSPDVDNEDGDIFEEIYPPQESDLKKSIYDTCVMLVQSKYKGEVLIQLLHQLKSAFDSREYMLMAMGIRTCIDIICRALIGKTNNGFKKNIDDCKNSGFISKTQLDIISPVIELGHGTVHRDYIPTEIEVQLAMRVVLNLIETHLIHAKVVKSVLSRHVNKKKTPKHSPKP